MFEFVLGKKKSKEEGIERESLIEVLNKQHDEITKKIKKLYNLYASDENDLLLETIEEQKKKLDLIVEQIQRETERGISSDKVKNLQKTLSTICETWEYMTPKERKSIIQECVEKVIVNGRNIEIYYKFKTIGVSLSDSHK